MASPVLYKHFKHTVCNEHAGPGQAELAVLVPDMSTFDERFEGRPVPFPRIDPESRAESVHIHAIGEPHAQEKRVFDL